MKREFLEEVNTTLKDGAYIVGYQQVDEEDGTPPDAQMRMTAVIDTIGQKRPGPDNGKTYGRLLISPQRAIELLNWGGSNSQFESGIKYSNSSGFLQPSHQGGREPEFEPSKKYSNHIEFVDYIPTHEVVTYRHLFAYGFYIV